MATEDAAGSGGPDVPDDEADAAVVAGAYSWGDLLREHGGGETARRLYEGVEPGAAPTTADWAAVDVDPAALLGFPPSALPDRLAAGDAAARSLRTAVADASAPDETPVAVGLYGWAEFEADVGATDRTAALGFPPDRTETALARASDAAADLADLVDERTVDVREEIDEDDFFTDEHGASTIVTRYDLERAVPQAKKSHFREEERYWVNEPYAFVILFHSTKENEKKYYVIEPHVDRIEADLVEFLEGKLRTAIKYSDDGVESGDREERRAVIEAETLALLDRYDIYTEPSESEGLLGRVADAVGGLFGGDGDGDEAEEGRDGAATLDGSAVRPEPAVLEEDPETLTEYQVEKLLYYLDRDFIGYERIDGIKHDVNVEDVSCDGYDSPVFVYHSDYEQIISNVYHGETELDDFVVKLAQRSGKGISKRRPQVDATLPDGSRAQLTLGDEVSDHGTNYTIRQFKDVPFTPIDLINWNTFSLEEMAYLWLCIENHKSLIFAGGTASGKTTSLNAVSLFIPSNSKIVSIEDTREVELPQRNWIASVTRPSFSDDDKGDIDEFQLLEAALRQRPDYIVMGEVRGEEGRTLFQVMSTGHTTYTTFHADNVGEVLKRFTTDPINVSKTMFTALDLVSVQTATRVQGSKVRRNKSLTEINHYDAENDEINVQDVFQWQAETDEFLKMGQSNTLEEIKFDRGWTQTRLDRELFERRTVLAYLIDRGLNSYTQVAATFQAYINDPETILALIATDDLERSLEDLREMESVLIEVDPEHEAMVPRPDPDEETAALAAEILERANEELLPEYADHDHEGIGSALVEAAAEADGVDLDRDEGAPDGAASAGGLDDALDLDPTAADGGTGADDEGVDDDPFAGAFAEANEDPDVLGGDDGDDDLDDWGFGEVSGGGGGG